MRDEEAPPIVLRAGKDYKNQEERARLIEELGIRNKPRQVLSGNVKAVSFAIHIIHEVMWFERSHQFRNGRPWGEQPWWRIKGFDAFYGGLDSKTAKQ